MQKVLADHFAKGNMAERKAQDRISGSGVNARHPDVIMALTELEGDTGLAAEFILRNFKPIEPLAIAKVEQTPSKHRRTPETSQGANVERIAVGSRRARPDRKKNLISGESRSRSDPRARVEQYQ
jgi:hypothetical protein